MKFDSNGLIPAIVQDVRTKRVLTLAYMNEQSLQKTKETGETWFYSRSRQELWHKGATSGHTQKVVDIQLDCDEDAILVLVELNGPACHTGSFSCFGEGNGQVDMLRRLEEVIAERDLTRPEGSYTTYLFEKGVDKILKKVGEEATEVVIAAKNRDRDELKWEVSDLFFHTLVLMREQGVTLDEIYETLAERHAKK